MEPQDDDAAVFSITSRSISVASSGTAPPKTRPRGATLQELKRNPAWSKINSSIQMISRARNKSVSLPSTDEKVVKNPIFKSRSEGELQDVAGLMTETDTMEHPVVILKEGWLKKSGNKRYFLLKRKGSKMDLQWFKSDSKEALDEKPQGAIEDFQDWKVYYFGGEEGTATDVKLEPPLKAGKKTKMLHTASSQEMNEWIEAIKRGKKEAKDPMSYSTPLRAAVHRVNPGKTLQSYLNLLPSNAPLRNIIDSQPWISFYGPSERVELEPRTSPGKTVSVRSVSSYPISGVSPSGEVIREGDPNADHYRIEVFNSFAIACVADGCGWGRRQSLASLDASEIFVEYLKKNVQDFRTLKNAGIHLIKSLEEAHIGTIERAKERGDDSAGTTTILGGVLVRAKHAGVWCWNFVYINLGDCKVFKYSLREDRIVDLIAERSRPSEKADDPGGRIGSQPLPDIRNLYVDSEICEDGDILFLVSDGVHDNFDPSSSPLNPRDIDESLPESWKEIEKTVLQKIVNSWREKEMMRVLRAAVGEKALEPEHFTKYLVDSCVAHTKSSRDFLENEDNKRNKLPSDYKLYPGKMDHTTLLAFCVGGPSFAPLDESETRTRSNDL